MCVCLTPSRNEIKNSHESEAPHKVPLTLTPPHLWPLRSCFCSSSGFSVASFLESVTPSPCFRYKGATIQDSKRPLIFKNRSVNETFFLLYFQLLDTLLHLSCNKRYVSCDECAVVHVEVQYWFSHKFTVAPPFSPPRRHREIFVQLTLPPHTLHARPSIVLALTYSC